MSLTNEQWSEKEIEKVLVETGVVPISTPAGRRVNVDGVHTNVSLSRFLRIFHLVRESHLECNDLNLLHLNMNQEVATSPCLLLVLRFLWEKSHSKRCLLDFLDTVHEYRPVLRHGKSSTWNPDDLNTFLTSSIDRKDLEQTNKIEQAALRLLSTTTLREILREEGSSPNENTMSSWMSSAGRDCELVAASLSSAQAHKPAIKMSRHGFNGGPSKPDCVEVVLREMFDLLLFDSTTSSFDSEARLPLTASPAVRDFYKRHSEVHLQDDDGSIEEIRSFEWFQLCSNLPMVDYTASSVSPLVADLSTVSMGLVGEKSGGAAAAKKLTKVLSKTSSSHDSDPNYDPNYDSNYDPNYDPNLDPKLNDDSVSPNNDYELVPTLSNVAKTMGVLLFGYERERDGGELMVFPPMLESLEEVAEEWQNVERWPVSFLPEELVFHSSSSTHRAPLSEETTVREVGGMKFLNGHHSIEFDLERLHNLAITRHKRQQVSWTQRPRELTMEKWLDELNEAREAIKSGAGMSVPSPFITAMRPALLGDHMLGALLDKTEEREKMEEMEEETQEAMTALLHFWCQKITLSWLSARWGEDRRSLSTLEEMNISSCSEGGHLFSSSSQQAQAEELEQVRRALLLVSRAAAAAAAVRCDEEDKKGIEENDKRMTQFVSTMLEWIIPKLGPRDHLDESDRLNGEDLSFANALELGEILSSLPVSSLRHVGVENIAPLLRSMIQVSAFNLPLVEAVKGLSLADKATLLRFRFLSSTK